MFVHSLFRKKHTPKVPEAYLSGLTLGPHHHEASSLHLAEKMKEKVKDAERIAIGTHQIPNALIMLALVSMCANFAFGYFTYRAPEEVSKVLQVAMSYDGSSTGEQEPRGSDDQATDEPPTFASSTHFAMIDTPSKLTVTAEAYVVVDTTTGEIILEKNAGVAYPIASVSKLITAIVTKEHTDPHHIATVTDDSYNTYGTEGGLYRGERILVTDLLYPLLMESSNDAAEVLARDYGREDFMALMNDKAASLGMEQTTFEDPSGLSPNNVSTAYDLTKLALYIKKAYPELLDITRVKEFGIADHSWKNQNYYLTFPNFLGGKNGFIDEAKKTTLSYFKVNFRGTDPNSKAEERHLALILLRSNDRNQDASNLLSFITRNIRYVSNFKE